MLACVWQGQRVADGDMTSDAVKENVMLRNENVNLRSRVHALQETVEAMTTRNAQLQADRDRLAVISSCAAGIEFCITR